MAEDKSTTVLIPAVGTDGNNFTVVKFDSKGKVASRKFVRRGQIPSILEKNENAVVFNRDDVDDIIKFQTQNSISFRKKTKENRGDIVLVKAREKLAKRQQNPSIDELTALIPDETPQLDSEESSLPSGPQPGQEGIDQIVARFQRARDKARKGETLTDQLRSDLKNAETFLKPEEQEEIDNLLNRQLNKQN